MGSNWKPDFALLQTTQGLKNSLSGDIALESEEDLEQVLKRLKDLQAHLTDHQQRGLAGLCTVGITLMEHLREHALLGPDDIREVIKDVVRQVHDTLTWAEPRRSPADVVKAALSAVGDEKKQEKLSLCDGQRLGELLITMSMLTPAQVQAALDLQRERGLKFGDALVEMKLLTRDMVQSALRVQKQRRTTGVDPWAQR